MKSRFRPGYRERRLFGQIAAVHFRHDHVGQEQMDLVAKFLGKAYGFARCSGWYYLIAHSFEHHLRHSQNRRFVLYKQDRPVAVFVLVVLCLIQRGFCHGLFLWQVNFETRPVVRLAVDINETVVLFYNAINSGQPQAGTLIHSLRGEERLKNIFQGLMIHTAAVVADGQHDVITGNKAEVIVTVALV